VLYLRTIFFIIYRGIFHNDAQTALAWVNEEDHCRIISMELGGDIPSVFTRFCALSNAIKVCTERSDFLLD
jgi:protein-arginine kinase